MMFKELWASLSVASVLTFGGAGVLRADDNSDVLALIQAAESSFRPVTAAEMVATRNELVTALDELEKYLRNSGDEIAEGWFKYLNWTVLQQQVRNPTGPDQVVLSGLLTRFFKSYDGLEGVAFLKARGHLRKFTAYSALFYSADPQAVYRGKLAEMKALVQRGPIRQLDVEGVQDLSHLNGWLLEGGQAPKLAERIRQIFSYSNLQVSLGSALLGNETVVRVDENTPIKDYILGSYVTGTARTKAEGKIIFYPNKDVADVRLELRGQTNSSSVARQGRVSVYSTAQTSIFAHKRFGFDGDRFLTYPATVQCVTRSQINSVSAPPIVRRIAWRKAHQLKPQAERIASQRTQQQVGAQLNEQVVHLLKQANSVFGVNLQQPLVRLGFRPMLHSSSTTSQSLHSNFLLARNDDLGAALPPPAKVGNSNIDFAVHESTFANTLDILLGGLKIADQDSAGIAELMLKYVPEALRVDPTDDDWYILLVDESPFLLQFKDGNKITATLNMKKFVRREVERQNGPMQVAEDLRMVVTYSIDQREGGWTAQRVGDVTITSPKPIDPDLSAFMLEKARAFYAESIDIESDIIPEGLLSFKILLRSLGTQGGWLRLGADYIK